jgi:hypothetical protein
MFAVDICRLKMIEESELVALVPPVPRAIGSSFEREARAEALA